MKKKHLGALFLLSTVCSFAQNSHPSHSNAPLNILLGEVADSVKVMNVFIENSPADYRIPNAPRFAIVGKNEKFYLGFGGYVKGTMSFDWGAPIHNFNEFVVSDIKTPAPGQGGLFGLSAQQSDLFLNMVALPDNPNKVGFYLNFIFLGNNYTPQVRQAYVKWRGIEMGYGFSLFSDMASDPVTIDYEGPNAFTVVINAKLNYRHTFGKHFGIGVGAELPMASYTNALYTATVSQRIPDIPMYLQWDFGNNNRIRLSGLVRNIQYRDELTNKNKNIVGGGIQLTGNFNISNKLIGYFQAAYGKGMTSYFQDVTGDGYDLVPCSDGSLQAVKAWGGSLGLQYYWSKKVFSNLVYSHLRLYTPDYSHFATSSWGEQYQYGEYAVANVFYNINSNLSWALEYLYGRRVNFDGSQAHDNRIQTMLQITF